MRGERRVLQDRIEALAVERCRIDALERVGGEQHEGEKAQADEALHRQHPRPERRRQVVAEQRHAGAVERQDPDPKDERALVIAPGGGDLVDQRLAGVRVGGDVGEREVGDHEALDQGGKRDGQEQELAERARAGERHQAGIAARGAQQRQRPLDQGEPERQHQGVVADLADHGATSGFGPDSGLAPASPATAALGRHMPVRFSASATSGGM